MAARLPAPAVPTAPTQQLSSNPAASSPISSNQNVLRVPSDALKADGGGDSCPKGATADHPIGCYLNGGWRVDVGDGRGYQAPPASGTSGAVTVQPSVKQGVTGTSSPQDPKATAASGPLV